MPKFTEELVAEQVKRSELASRKMAESGISGERPVITISRRMGSGARIVAIKLAEQLGWSLWGKDLINAMAENAEVSKRVADAFDEKTMSEIERLVRSMLGDYELGGYIYTRHLAHAVASIAKLGNAIILGRGANFLLPNALHIRIDASDEVRIRNMMNYENLTREQAVQKLRESDREREEFLVKTFTREKVENFHYDLTIWMDNFNPDAAVDIIKTALKWRFKKDSA